MFVPNLRPEKEFEAVLGLVGRGLSDVEISRRTGVPKSTVGRWRLRPYRLPRAIPPPPKHWRPADEWAYCYLLGHYLGDGHLVVEENRTPSLHLSLDAQYTLLIAAASNAMARTAPGATIRTIRKAGCLGLWTSDSVWPAAFPQHGPGRKHLRPIRLTDWQLELTRRHPKALLRGLIHSDGCRTVNRFSVALPSGSRQYAYPRYFFSNHSMDIQRIFGHHCELLGVRWTQSKPFMLSVSHRKSVALLDSFIGPKA
jgi:hypothetical protein